VTEANLPPGFEARPIDPQADVDAVTELCASAGMAEYGTPDITPELVRESYNDPSFNPSTDGLVLVDSSGRLGAVVEYYDSQADHVAPFVFVRVRPDLLGSGIGEPLLAWADQRGQTTLGLAAPDLRVSLHAFAAGVNEPMQRIFEGAGWTQERIFWTMEIELGAEPPAVPALPAGVAIRTAVAAQDEPAIHAAEAEAFADHFGYIPRSYEEWLRFATKIFPYDPSLWFLALADDQVAGMALCLIEAPGRPDVGWVATLGVRPAWRGQGVGLALLKHAFAELHRRGLRKVGLGVDSQSLTGATRLYERAGMQVARDSRSYERVLREGREIRPT
jgi:mycothiol synthase